MSAELFSVYQFSDSDESECVARDVEGREAMQTFDDCTNSRAARMGITHRVIIMDGYDRLLREWQFGQRLTYY
jgi:hypothetical protein